MLSRLVFSLLLVTALPGAAEENVVIPEAKASADTLMSYRRVLPLEGGSNFRDLGGYPAADGKEVKRGLLFRSGAMTGLTEKDVAYLEDFGFESVVDLRSDQELELYPNHWAETAGLNYVHHEYSMMEMMKQAKAMEDGDRVVGEAESSSVPRGYSGMYLTMMDFLKPQLTLYFDTLLNGAVPAVVNCSAGQDRTGVTSSLLLSVLGVDRELILEDYLLSTDFRRPLNEKGNVDLKDAAKTNAFAAMMLQYSAGQPHPERPNPLVTAEGKPFVAFTLETIEARYGSVANYLQKEIGLSAEEQAQLRDMYLQ